MALGQPLGALSQQSPFLLIDVTVEAGKRIALDPIAAIGYDYQIGAGDPLFASVELPDIGDGLFALYLFIGTDWIFDRVLSASEEYFFAGSGVDRFCILVSKKTRG